MIHAIHFFFSDASYNMYDRKNTTAYFDTIVNSVCQSSYVSEPGLHGFQEKCTKLS